MSNYRNGHKMMANAITISRIVFSIILLYIAKESNLFILFYILCGATDILDGFIARVLHTESEVGAILDSIVVNYTKGECFLIKFSGMEIVA